MIEQRKEILAIILLCAVTFAAYINTLPNTFIFDDNHMIVKNNYIKNTQYIPLFFKGEITSEPIAKGMYRPILMLSFMFNYLTGGLKPYGYHLINILIHFLNAVLLYLLLKFLLIELKFALRLAITLIFCLHPINTEAVAYISSRSDLLCSFFILSGFYAYILSQVKGGSLKIRGEGLGGDSPLRRKRGQFLYLLSLCLYPLGLLTKESGLVFLGLIFAYELFYTQDILRNLKRVLLRLLPFLLLTFGYLFLQKAIFGNVFGLFGKVRPSAFPLRPLSANILTQAAVSFFHLYLFFFPFNLCIDHNFPIITTLATPLGLISLILIFVLITTCLFLRSRTIPIVGFSCLWYFICLSPKFYARLNLVAAEHQAYLAYFSLYFIFGFLLAKWRIKKIYLRQLFFFILGLFFLLTVLRNLQWRNKYILWKSTLKVNPDSGIAKAELWVDLYNQGLFVEAETFLKDSAKTASSKHTRIISLLNLAIYYALRDEPEKGLEILEQKKNYLLRAYPFGYYKNLGFIKMRMGEIEEAGDAWVRALRFSPNNARIEAMLGVLYLEHFSDFKKAKEYFNESIKHNPNSVIAHLGLARALENEDLKEAIRQYQEVIRISPRHPLGYFYLGLIYAQKLLSSEAEWYFKKATEVSPNFAPAYYNLCIFYLSLPEPDFERAQEYFDKARELGYKIDSEIKDMLQKREISLEKDYYISGHIGE